RVFVARGPDAAGTRVEEFVGIRPEIRNGLGEDDTLRRARIVWVVAEIAARVGIVWIAGRREERILGRIVALELHGCIVASDAPRKAVVLALSQPVQFTRIVAIARIVCAEQVAVRREGEVIGIPVALGEDVSGR